MPAGGKARERERPIRGQKQGARSKKKILIRCNWQIKRKPTNKSINGTATKGSSRNRAQTPNCSPKGERERERKPKANLTDWLT